MTKLTGRGTLAGLAGGILLAGSGAARAQLVLTEVDFANDMIEITNVGDTPTGGTTLFACVAPPRTYPPLHTMNFNFAAGQVRTYSVPTNLLAPGSARGLWIYLDSINFDAENNVISGVVWGGNTASVGGSRTTAVVNQTDAWDLNTDFVVTSAIPVGHTLQLMPGTPSASTSANWIIAPANLGTYQLVVEAAPLKLSIRRGPGLNEATLVWPVSTPGTAELQETTTLADAESWAPTVGSPVVVGENNELVVAVSGERFYRLAN